MDSEHTVVSKLREEETMSMLPKRIVVLGGGFAGLWSAVGAARLLDELGLGADLSRSKR
jgi:hypothetical protein